MTRPKKCRRVSTLPKVSVFGPIDLSLGVDEITIMTVEEYESIRLMDLDGLNQEQCAEAMVGNFIDFGAMDKVDINKLKNLIKNATKEIVNDNEYNNFLEELKNAKQIAYIVDNSGEIVFDKIFIKLIKEMYPEIIIDVIVRGKPVHNDATIVDAEEVGLCSIVNVIENGTDIPGTQLNEINVKSKEIIDNADLIIAKGQGNFETLFGCGKNIYYIFLCKCDLFTKRFNMEKFQGVFINESNVKIVQ